MFAKTAFASNIVEARSATEVFTIVENFPQETIIFLDVDDTLITPKSTSFRTIHNIIEEIKKDKDQYKNFEEILGNWRLQRKIMLLDKNWPSILAKLKEKYRVYGLTKMDSGKFGNIKSMEDWRYMELKSLALEFTNDIESEKPSNIKGPVFYKGIFFTGISSKSGTLEIYKSQLKTNRIILVDDRLDHLEDINSFCKKEHIEFTGILYKGLETILGEINPDLAKIQKEYLIKNATWLEDEEAIKL